MSKLSSAAKIIGLIVLIGLVGLAIGWWGSRGTTGDNAAPGQSSPTNDATRVAAVPPSPASNRWAPSLMPRPVPRNLHPATPGQTTSTNLITNWEDRVDTILGSDAEEAEKAKQMLEMFPQLPADGQLEVAQHLSNLVTDENYAALGALLADPALPEDVLDVLVSDALNRPNSLKLPMLLELAQNPQHPKAGEARDLLELFLEENYGDNWTAWQSAVQRWLQDNPD